MPPSRPQMPLLLAVATVFPPGTARTQSPPVLQPSDRPHRDEQLQRLPEEKRLDERGVNALLSRLTTVLPVRPATTAMTASSHSRWRDRVYAPGNVVDGNHRTAWVEGVRGHGVGEWLAATLDFGADGSRLAGVLIIAGFAKNRTMWARNSRPQRLLLRLRCPEAPERTATLSLEDHRLPQLFFLSEPWLAEGRCELRLTIATVYPGTHYADTSIAEIVLLTARGEESNDVSAPPGHR